MSERIQPALSDAEWAKLAFEEKNGEASIDRGDGSVLCSANDGGHEVAVFAKRPLALAALCLHGRISWEMVDALRAMIASHKAEVERVSRRSDCPSPPALDALRDLLESLLPPR